ncbi:MAG: hypothetical protein JW846_03395 [Dehalococcoidia bacterium]|nr:hypothetical protein [Dehalococcoidia bacterium]
MPETRRSLPGGRLPFAFCQSDFCQPFFGNSLPCAHMVRIIATIVAILRTRLIVIVNPSHRTSVQVALHVGFNLSEGESSPSALWLAIAIVLHVALRFAC